MVRGLFFLFVCLGMISNSMFGADFSYRMNPANPYAVPPHSSITLPDHLKPLVILDAGHGGEDEGSRVHSMKEKRITLITTFLTKKFLEEMGHRVILTRSRDTFLTLPQRVEIANKSKASLFVSIHYNAAARKEAKGIEVFYCNSKEEIKKARASRRLANYILHHLLDQTEAHSRGVKQGNHHVTRETYMPAVLVEGGFLTNQEERTLLKDRDYLEKVARGIAHGIDSYLKS